MLFIRHCDIYIRFETECCTGGTVNFTEHHQVSRWYSLILTLTFRLFSYAPACRSCRPSKAFLPEELNEAVSSPELQAVS